MCPYNARIKRLSHPGDAYDHWEVTYTHADGRPETPTLFLYRSDAFMYCRLRGVFIRYADPLDPDRVYVLVASDAT